MTKEEKYAKLDERLRKKKEKAAAEKKKEREKRRRAGYRKWLAEKHKEMRKKEEKEKRAKEREKARREKDKLKPKKRKPGRPKKRGPKKKRVYKSRKPVVKAPRPTFDHKIVLTENGRQTGYYGTYMDVKDAYEAMERIVEESSSVVFPRRVKSGGGTIINEALLLEKNRDGEKEDSVMRNEFGKLVRQETNLKNWVILDKRRIDTEETFWIYGFSPKTERKTISWFMENGPFREFSDRTELRRIAVYLNKVVVKYDDGSFDMAICKDMGEAVKFYNIMLETAQNAKMKQLMFLGSYSELSPKRRKLEAELVELTGWSLEQLRRRQTKK